MGLNLADYALVLDVWEGSGDINEGIIKAAGVEALAIRMNCSNGALYYDADFLTQWQQATAFKRAAYVVVNPGIGKAASDYVTWILAFKPAECKVIALDVEIDGGVTPSAYSVFVADIIKGLRKASMTVLNYSGSWFYSLVSPWPSAVDGVGVDQWWARYLNAVHPVQDGVAIHPTITWDALKALLVTLPWIPLVDGASSPGHIAMWQVTSSYVLPGCQPGDPVDVNLMPRADFNRIFGTTDASATGTSTGTVLPDDHSLISALYAKHPELWK